MDFAVPVLAALFVGAFGGFLVGVFTGKRRRGRDCPDDFQPYETCSPHSWGRWERWGVTYQHRICSRCGIEQKRSSRVDDDVEEYFL